MSPRSFTVNVTANSPGAGTPPSPRAALSYRVALCQEGLGRWDQALAAFREAAAEVTPAGEVAA